MIHAVRALDEYAAEWRRLPRATAAQRAAADAYYDQQVLPLLRMDFQREHAHLSRRYTHLVVALGADPTPAILSLAALQPERAHFLYQAVGVKHPAAQPCASEDLSRVLHPYWNGITPYDRTRVDDPAILQAYAAVRDVHAAWGAPVATAVDITGATPAMAAGMAMAAYAAGADLLAIEAGEMWPDVGRPRPGSEHLAFLPQPYAAFGDLVQSEARRAWARHDFSLACDLFAHLARVVDAAHYAPYRDLAGAYAAWQAFDAAAAARGLDATLAGLAALPAHPLAAHRRGLLAQAEAMASLAALTSASEEPPELEVLARLDWVTSLAFSLARSAHDHAAAGRYDLATLLQYRLLELLVQRRLAVRGISTVAPDYSALGLADPAAALATRRRVRLGEEEEQLPRTIGLGVGLVLLDLLADPVARAVDWPHLRQALPARSRSVLIHGFRALGPGSYEAFQRLLEPIFDAFCRVEGLDCLALAQTFDFVQV